MPSPVELFDILQKQDVCIMIQYFHYLCPPNVNEFLDPKDVDKNVHSSFIHNTLEWESLNAYQKNG